MSNAKKIRAKVHKAAMIPMFILLLNVVFGASNVFALKTIDLKEGVTEFVEVSNKDLNAIVFPVDVKVFTKSDNLEVKIQDKRVFVSFKQDMESVASVNTPEQLYLLTDSKTYSIVLIPKGIPSETVIAKIDTLTDKDEALNWEKEQPYVDSIKNLIKAMYTNNPPNGYTVEKIDSIKDVSKWNGIIRRPDRRYAGASFAGEVHVLKNETNETVRFKEQEFYERGVIAVSIDSHELQPGEETEVYIVTNHDTLKTFDMLSR